MTLVDEPLVTVRLYGKLGAKFGRVHQIAVKTCAEAVQFLSAMLPGFEREFVTAQDRGVKYAAFYSKKNLSEKAIYEPHEGADIRIAPVISGSKSGAFTFLLGAALFFVAPYLAPMIGNVAGALGFDAIGVMLSANSALVGIGASMMLGGVIQMISPQQKGLATSDGPDNGASYNMNGTVNTTAQGGCVPLLYGECWTGSANISGAIVAEDQQ